MTNITTCTPALRPLAWQLAAFHQDNPVLKAALRSQRVATVFPTALCVSEAEQSALYPGYYLRCADGNNYWIGRDKAEARSNLDQATIRYLKPEFGYEYDVEYSFGHVVGSGSPWLNLSAIDELV